MQADPTDVRGCVVLRLEPHEDARGGFLKLFRRDEFAELGLDPTVAEVFWSTSRRGVVRGLHFQAPPHDHAKTVAVVSGAIYDVVVDLRLASPTYGRSVAFTLEAGDGRALHVPTGCAHGFQALTDDATVLYLVGTEHAPSHDAGIRWDSVEGWPISPAVVSDRDAAFPALSDFTSPFLEPADA